MKSKEVLKHLCTSTGISGEETSVSEIALTYLKQYAQEAYIDEFNNVIGVIKKAEKNQPSILLDAHIDEIGMVVTYIDSNGFLRVSNCGGVDRRLLLGQQVTICAKQTIPGIIATLPPHLTGTEEKKVPDIDDILIDIGMSYQEAQKVVRLGDRVMIHSEFCDLLGSRISSKALDDRCGIVAILEALEQLKDKELHCGLTVLFSAQEETGERGAAIASYELNPDIALAVDVSFAHTPDARAHQCGKLGKGVMIGIAPTLNKKVYQKLIALAKAQQIPFQEEVMGGKTGTNADVIGVQHGGIQTGLLSIPLKYMHTPIEVIDINDLENVSNLLAQYILSFGGAK